MFVMLEFMRDVEKVLKDVVENYAVNQYDENGYYYHRYCKFCYIDDRVFNHDEDCAVTVAKRLLKENYGSVRLEA